QVERRDDAIARPPWAERSKDMQLALADSALRHDMQESIRLRTRMRRQRHRGRGKAGLDPGDQCFLLPKPLYLPEAERDQDRDTDNTDNGGDDDAPAAHLPEAPPSAGNTKAAASRSAAAAFILTGPYQVPTPAQTACAQ